MYIFILLLLFLNSCIPPIYEEMTYGIDEFIQDSTYIAAGMESILNKDEVDESECEEEQVSFCTASPDEIIEGDELSLSLYCFKRPEWVEAVHLMGVRSGFKVIEGKIYLPNIGLFEIAGMTLIQAKEAIQSLYCDQINDIQVYLNFKKQRKRFVQIIGAREAVVPIDANTYVSEVLAKAKLPAYANLYKSYVIRENQKIPIDLYRLVHLGDQCQNILAKGGDQIYIAKMNEVTVMVTGEIMSMDIPLPFGHLSLVKALALVEGVPFTGDETHIYVIRGALQRPKIYLLKWKEIVHHSHQSLLLMEGDIVYIAETPITKWNRFISQLRPSVNCCGYANGFCGYHF